MTEALTRDEQYRIVYQAICGIAERCDGAVERDFVGFDGSDTKFGRRIAAVPYEQWTDEIKADAAFILGQKYHGQAHRYTGLVVDKLDVVRDALEESGTPWRWAARDQARRFEYVKREKASRTVQRRGDWLIFSFKYNDEIRVALKDLGARWNAPDKTWDLALTDANSKVAEIVERYEFRVADAETDAAIDNATPYVKPAVGTAVLAPDHRLLVTLVGKLSREAFDQYRRLEGYDWIRRSNQSFVEQTKANVDWLEAHEFTCDFDHNALESAMAARQAEVEAILAASKAETSDRDLTGVFPEGLAPYPFQAAGIDFILDRKRALVGDEMGLGKTIQALGAVVIADAYPAVVVCPASLKGNWAKEIRKWDPHHSVSVLAGRQPNNKDLLADWIIVNYDILSAWVDKLVFQVMPEALVVDESHYVKEAKAKRSKAVLKLAHEGVAPEGLVMLLTGTPILNRPIELVTQLRVLGKLADIVPPSRRSSNPTTLEFGFKFAYCGPEKNDYGKWLFNGSSNEKELNERLRSTCMIRRERTDVLGLNDTKRVRISLALNGALKAYRKAEDDVIRYLTEEVGREAAIKAMRAEVLVRLNLLRKLAEEAKIAAAIEWVEDWLESYPDKALVVFAEHIAVQKAIAVHFGCPTILGSQRDVEAQKEIFQSGQSRLIVCSLKAAREGHTLTAASDVVFTGLGWTPGGLQQAEDRCNRIGQEADQVYAWQLSADDTVDDEIADLIEAKRQTFNAVVKGEGESRDFDHDDEIVSGAIDYLIRKGDRKNRS